MAKLYALMLVVGALVGYGVAVLTFDDPGPAENAPLQDRIARLQQRLDALARDKDAAEAARGEAEAALAAALARVRELEAEAAAAEAAVARGAGEATGDPAEEPGTGKPPPDGAPGDPIDLAGLEAAARKLGPALGRIMMGGDAEEERAELRAAFARATPEALRAFIEKFRTSGDANEQFMMAHVLAQSGRPEAIDALRDAMSDEDGGLMLRRTASHGLAFSDAEGVAADLERAAQNAADNGVRANTAFGLARRGNETGMRLYAEATDRAIAERDPAALQYLGGMSLLGDLAKPYVRERLETYEGQQERLMLIQFARSSRDADALPVLDRLAQTDTDAEIRKAAESAARAIRGE